MIKLFKFQEKEVESLIKTFKTHNTACLSWYTGAGKTNVFLTLCKRMIEKNPSIKIGISSYFTTEVRDQIFDRCADLGIQDKAQLIHSTLSGPLPADKSKNIYIFNPQTIQNIQLDVKLDLFIIDEGHAGMAPDCKLIKLIRKSMCHKETKTLIVSATPWDTLSLKEFKDIPVHKRPLDLGMQDGLITDFKFHAEEAQITFTEDDFSRTGDLKKNKSHFTILKSACLGKMKYLIEKYDKDIGNKCVVICPPGNNGEVARSFAEEFNGLAYIQQIDWSEFNTSENLDRFKNEKDIRFLFVINKCQVGFDMQELCSIIDLTMSRNIKVLAQRLGRIARVNGAMKKHYFYVYDKSLMKGQLEWLIMTVVDFTLGHYDGWTTRTTKWRSIRIYNKRFKSSAIYLSEVIKTLSNPENVINVVTLKYVTQTSRPTYRTLESALIEAKKYSSRTELWINNPGCYKWFRLHGQIEELNKVFPYKLKVRPNYWNEDRLIEEIKKYPTRRQFNLACKGARDHIGKNNLHHLLDEYLPRRSTARKVWTEDLVKKHLSECPTWRGSHSRSCTISFWMRENKGTSYWRKYFYKMKGKS